MEPISSDAAGLLEAFERGDLVRPGAEQLNSVDLALAIASLVCDADPPASPGRDEIAALIGASDHLVFVPIDGLGMNFVDKLPEDSFLRSNVVREINAPFPSTTSVSFTTYATGMWPAQHSVTSWFTHIPEIVDTATVLPYVRTRDGASLSELGLTPRQVFPAPTLPPHYSRDTLFVHPAGIVGTVYTRYQSGNSPAAAYDRYDFGAAAEIVVNRVRRAPGQTFTFVYSDLLDMAAHEYGSSSTHTLRVLSHLDRAIGELASRIKGNATMVVTSDHGHLDAPLDQRYFVEPGSALDRMTVCRPAGDARVMFFHLRNGRTGRSGQSGEFEERFRDAYGDAFFLLSSGEVEELRLLGPSRLHEITRSRIGDYTAISRGGGVIDYRPAADGYPMASVHSGLNPDEMRIPLIIS